MTLNEWKASINVLIIEDNLDLLEMYEIIMSQAEFKNLYLAKNSDEAEHLLKTIKVDLCLSDIKFPTKDGVTVMKNAKVSNLTPGILIFISGFNDYPVEDLKAIGACNYFEKPVRFTELLSYIESKFLEKKAG